MKTFLIQTLGCKVNQYESQQIDQWLRDRGLRAAGRGDRTDLVVINTCCVTRTASSKSRQSIRKACKENPSAAVVVAGCLPAGPAEESAALSEHVIFVPEKDLLSDTLHSVLTQNHRQNPILCSKPASAEKIKGKNKPDHEEVEFLDPFGPLHHYSGHTRAFLKIQDGCDAYCTYCIISKIRKRLWSKPVGVILEEARSLVSSGHPEIVLTGIFLGAWGRDTALRRHWDPAVPGRLPELMRQLVTTPGLVRLRLSSIEPGDVTDELIEVYQHNPVLAPHLHLPLQSGSPRILRRMARQYTVEEYVRICEKLQDALDRPAITTDIMVGFPGETDADFELTLDICRRVNFAKIHVFPYSPRSGTPAVRLKPPVAAAIIRRRAEHLRQLDKQLQDKFRRQFIGETVQVILENIKPPQGHCERYFMVNCSDVEQHEPLRKGQIIPISINV